MPAAGDSRGEDSVTIESPCLEMGGLGSSVSIWTTSLIVGLSTACSSTHSIAT